MPLLSCIVTAFNEGEAARLSIQSLLNQTQKDFEIIVVDDGASDVTRSTLESFVDGRLKYLRQANTGPSAARNRGLRHARGEYVCFLDADDMRPVWAFQSVADALEKHGKPDLLVSRGMLSELRGELLPFYDDYVFDFLAEYLGNGELIEEKDARMPKLLPFLLLLEPQSANKFVRRKLIQERAIQFPNGHIFEDMQFHAGVVGSLKSFAVLDAKTFTYFRRYGHTQLTSGTGEARFESIAVARNIFKLFQGSSSFQNVLMRGALALSLFKLLLWCEESISHMHRHFFRQLALFMTREMDERYLLAALDNSSPVGALTAGRYDHVREYIRTLKNARQT